ncbi:protein ERGIC-53-like [Ornithodoros turicata]|uniref:Putative mannose lectin ergic-53 involved in glycoprotein traffic n=1 Tax=Ornithodoros turicata TaxID=34597 RepID=A0A2R5LGD5_9ACAR
MASSGNMLIFSVLLIICICLCHGELAHKKFEYKYSFKGPYLAQKDSTVPFWEYEGHALASDDMVRITPSLRSQKGSMWTKSKTAFDWWEIEIIFRVTGRGRLGADGLAFWFTDRRMPPGPVFGSSDKWVGLGVFMDSFDNDNKNNNPYVMAMVNDGTKEYDHNSDGSNQQLSGCLRDFRNKPFPARVKIEYYKNVISIMMHSGNTNSDEDYELCLRAENVFLPQFGHFGISAATGGLADDHDVLKFLTSSLYLPGTQPTTQGMAEAEKEKFSKEYEQYKEKLEKQKEEYRKLHPEEAARREMEHGPDQQYDTQQQRELRQIFETQNHMFEGVKAVHRKLDEILGRQERTLSLVSTIQTGGVASHQPMGQGQPMVAGPGGMQRHEVDSVLASQREIVQAVHEIKSFVAEVHQRTSTILAAQQQGGTAGAGAASTGYEHMQTLNELKDSLNDVKRDVAYASKVQRACPTVSCLSPAIFFLFGGVQLAVMIGYMMYRSNKEAAAKKFY